MAPQRETREMIVATWNVNGVRSRLQLVAGWMMLRQPDVICLQELKVEPKDFPRDELRALGWDAAFTCQKNYNGVAILARRPITDVQIGFDDGQEEYEARLISATVGGARVVCAYVPHGRDIEAELYQHKLAWIRRLRAWLDARHKPDQPLVLCGDFNVTPEPRDVFDPKLWASRVHFHADARNAYRELLGFGLYDTFRLYHAGAGLYSYWDYRENAWPKNHGLRIDHVLATKPMAERCLFSAIDRAQRTSPHASDHVPVMSAFTELG